MAPGRLGLAAVAVAAASAVLAVPSIRIVPAPAVSPRPGERPLPLAFEENRGQTDARVDFVARAARSSVYLTSSEAVVALGAERSRAVLRMKLVGAEAAARPVALDRLPGSVNYLVGRDPRGWRTGIPTYAKVLYRGVYPGVDLLYYGNRDGLEYDLVVSPHADPARVRLLYRGAQEPRLDRRGALVLRVGEATLRQSRPVAWQEVAGVRRRVPVEYEIRRRGDVRFRVGRYDRSQPLVIDPVLSYSTYLGGLFDDRANAIAVDGEGNAIVAGVTTSSDFPTTGGPQSQFGGYADAFVTKLNETGTAVLYSTYLGGSSEDVARAIAVDSAGSAYVVGSTYSGDFPVANAFQPARRGPGDAFVTKLDPTGAMLEYSTYLGGATGVLGYGSAYDEAHAIAVDSMGSAYVTGSTQANDFPTVNAVQPNPAGTDTSIVDAFVTKFDPSGAALAYSTYLGGTYREEGRGIAVSAVGEAVVAGVTHSSDFPTANALRTTAQLVEGFVSKLSAAGSEFVYSTYLGGDGDDEVNGVALDALDAAYVVGSTRSNDFPTTPGAFDTRCGTTNYCSYSNSDAFATKIAADGSELGYSTLLGADGSEHARGVAVGADGNATVVGVATYDFPVADAIQPNFGGGTIDGFVTELDPTASTLVHSSYLGGNWYDGAMAVAAGSPDDVYVTGFTASTNFTTTEGAYDRTGGNTCNPDLAVCHDAFAVRIAGGATQPDTTPPSVSVTQPATGAVVRGNVTITATATDDTSVRQVEFLVNGNPVGYDAYEPYEVTWISPTVADGPATITVRAEDPSANSATSAPRHVIVDNYLPETTIDSAPTDPGTTATFAFSSSEAASTFECALDGGAYAPCSSPKQYTGLSTGSHAFQVRAADAASNRDTTPAGCTWSVGTSRNLLTNGAFECALTGWAASSAVVSIASGGAVGPNAARVAAAPGAREFGVYTQLPGTARPGRPYTADAWVLSPHVRVCLYVKERLSARVVVGSASTCAAPRRTWQQFPRLRYTARRSGSSLELGATAFGALPASSFLLDGVTVVQR